MLQFLLVFALVALVAAQQPPWYSGECGRSKYADAGDMDLPALRDRIVGGVEAREFEFPWQVSIRVKSNDWHFCGGSIINERWILTAAHCMEGEVPGLVSVVIGEQTRNDTSNTVRQHLNVEQIIMHENYDSDNIYNDIALVKVMETIQFSDDIQPVCGPDPAIDYTYRKSVCSGWGTTISGGGCCPQTLRYVSMNVTTQSYCVNAYPPDWVTPDMICASDNNGSNDRDSCQGDSGGPLTVKEDDGSFTLIGVVSWGIGCASGYPGVYARVAHFNDWVLGNIS